MFDIGRADGDVTLRVEEDMAALLRRLNTEYRHFLEQAPDDDPAYGRLFPQAYEDPEHEAAYVELVRTDLERAKVRVAQDMAGYLDGAGSLELRLGHEHVHAWLTWLTDLRLVIAARIGVTDEMMERDLDPRDPNASSLTVLDLLAWLQESLLEAIDI